MQNNNVEGILTHFYNKNTFIQKETNIVTKIKPYDFFTKNEILINNILHLLEYKTHRYITIKKATKLRINEVDDTIIKLYNENENKKFIILKYDENENIYIKGITNFLYNKNEKDYIYGVVESYVYLMKTFFQLQNEGIIHFNFTSEKLKFKDIYNPHCILYDFECSLLEKKLNQTNKSDIIEYFHNFIFKTQNFSFKPFEVHLLFYLYKMEEHYLSKYRITKIIDKYVENMKNILKVQDDSFIKRDCNKFVDPFINKNKNYIILELIKYYKTWDNYSASILYLHLVDNIIQGYKTQITFMNKFQSILYTNLSLFPSQRMTLEDTIIRFNTLFQHWIFL